VLVVDRGVFAGKHGKKRLWERKIGERVKTPKRWYINTGSEWIQRTGRKTDEDRGKNKQTAIKHQKAEKGSLKGTKEIFFLPASNAKAIGQLWIEGQKKVNSSKENKKGSKKEKDPCASSRKRSKRIHIRPPRSSPSSLRVDPSRKRKKKAKSPWHSTR
jgi:hypothetical protein